MSTNGSYISKATPNALAGSSFVYIRIGEKEFYAERDAFKGKQLWGGYFELVDGNGNVQSVIDALPGGQPGDLPLMFELSRSMGASPMVIMHNAYVTINLYRQMASAGMWKNRLILASTADVFLKIEEDISRMTGDSAPQYKAEWAVLKGLERCEIGSSRTGWGGLVLTFDYTKGFSFNGTYETFVTWASGEGGIPPLPDDGTTPTEPPTPVGQPTNAEIANAIRVLARVFTG